MLLLSVLASVLSAAPRIHVQGHRGARAVLPENTLPAFEYAIEVGADVLELDLGVTKDNIVVVSHDPVLDPRICRGPSRKAGIRELTLPELRAWDCGALKNPRFPRQKPAPGTPIPTLDEVFELADRGDFHFNIETKSFPDTPEYTPSPEEFARLVVEAVRRHGLEERVIVQSFDFRTLHAVRKLAPQIRLSALYASGLRDFVSVAREAGAEIISPHYSLVTREKVRRAHEAGLQVVPWTANRRRIWDRLIKAGVDGIITDDPEGLIRYLEAKGLR